MTRITDLRGDLKGHLQGAGAHGGRRNTGRTACYIQRDWRCLEAVLNIII